MGKKNVRECLFWGSVVLLCGMTFRFYLFPVEIYAQTWRNRWLSEILQHVAGISAVLLLCKRFEIRLFERPQQLLYFLPCMVIAVNNFQWYACVTGKMQLVLANATDIALFVTWCLSVGLFEECVFRGLIFYLLASTFSRDKKGLTLTVLSSSAIFGVSHLINLFAGAGIGTTLLQVCYTVLTGGLFAYALLQTKNILFPAFVHATYNFCGLLMETPQNGGLGAGVVFDMGTIGVMAVVAVITGIFILYLYIKYPKEEQTALYQRFSL